MGADEQTVVDKIAKLDVKGVEDDFKVSPACPAACNSPSIARLHPLLKNLAAALPL